MHSTASGRLVYGADGGGTSSEGGGARTAVRVGQRDACRGRQRRGGAPRGRAQGPSTGAATLYTASDHWTRNHLGPVSILLLVCTCGMT